MDNRSGFEKADSFEKVVAEIEEASGGTWTAIRMTATDDAVVFAGRQGEIVVFTGDGGVLRGNVGSWRLTSAGIALDYAKLVKV